MTDHPLTQGADPMPDQSAQPSPLTSPLTSPLAEEQRQRVAALAAARNVLAARGFASTGSVNALDLVHVAAWVITGDDPWSTPAATLRRERLLARLWRRTTRKEAVR